MSTHIFQALKAYKSLVNMGMAANKAVYEAINGFGLDKEEYTQLIQLIRN